MDDVFIMDPRKDYRCSFYTKRILNRVIIIIVVWKILCDV